MTVFKTGDHLVTNIDILGVTEHHGLYMGQGDVIHLTGQYSEILKTSVHSFSGGKEVRIKRSASNPICAIETAKEELGTTGYHVLFKNCEQFVNYCLDKIHTSNQVSNAAHLITHVAARNGVFGSTAAEFAKSTVGTIAIVSTGAKAVGEYVGLPDSINTVIGTPGDLLAKPLEAGVIGVSKTVGDTYEKLSEGEIVDAVTTLVEGTVDTAIDIVEAPFKVVGSAFNAIASWFD
ncbi:lecithin retinol acyltransferase family protein [Colwellia sp. 12G3]|uniref:lecithin retinol acyltransferase family protein n=1 Tax=Colwellia sp. 12G3 TaxID=2058299 RepID=UPI000C32E25B|nr:lecithin retinol acyltransferase family protein [Colwellia sp. 12G3]PKI12737.1 acyltransferase [Colwellia sp. 12G3]